MGIKQYTPAFRKPTDWTTWWLQFQSYANIKEFGQVLKAHKISSLPTNEMEFDKNEELVAPSPAHTDEQKEALKANAIGIAELYVAFSEHTTQDPLRFLKLSKTKNWPTGRCWIVVQELIDEYQPDRTTGKVELDKALQRMHLDKHENPKNLFSQLAAILNKYEDTIEIADWKQLEAIMTAAPSRYRDQIISLRLRYRISDNREPTIKELRKEMFNIWYQER